MDKKVKQLFTNGNRNSSECELLLAYQCAAAASTAKEFEELLDSALAHLNGVTKLNEEDGRDLIGRTFNVLAGLHKAQLRSNCLEVLARFGDDPAAVAETLGDLVRRMLEPKSKARKPKTDDDSDDEAPKSRKSDDKPRKKKEESDDEAPKGRKKKEESDDDKPRTEEAKPPKEEKPRVPIVMPKKSGLPKPEY